MFEDWFFRIVVGLAVAVTAAVILFIFLHHPTPYRYVGLPAHGACSYPADDGTRTCVANDVVYTCVTNYRESVVTCAPSPRAR